MNRGWWESHRTRYIVDVPEGSIIGPPPPRFMFENIETFRAVRCELVVNDRFLLCLKKSKCFRNLTIYDGQVDPAGVDFSFFGALAHLSLVRCGIGSGQGKLVFPVGVRDVDLSENGITDLTRLNFKPTATELPLSLVLSGNPIRSVTDLDCSSLRFLYLRDCGITSMYGWIPPSGMWYVDLTGNLLTGLPEYMTKGALVRTCLCGNPIEDISQLCGVTVDNNSRLVFKASNFTRCPLNRVSRSILAAVAGMGGDENKINRYTLAVRQVKLLWCTEERLPRDLCRSLRSYLI